mmetsp:Transcript_14592/g.37467  ORF Transcript_14592/g.37467 Transcript_14592/m.37467 type:complete len:202 (+) Transcript_14592:742-1347(+)
MAAHRVAMVVHVSLQVVVICHRTPQEEEGDVHHVAEANSGERPNADVPWGVLKDAGTVSAAEDAREARVEEGQHRAKVDPAVIVWAPVVHKGLTAEACNVIIVAIQIVVRRGEEAKVVREDRVEDYDGKDNTKLRHDVNSPIHQQRQAGQEAGANGLHVAEKAETWHGHGQRLDCSEALKHRQQRDGEPVHEADRRTHNGT